MTVSELIALLANLEDFNDTLAPTFFRTLA